MKRRLFTAALVIGVFALSSCQKDIAMEELVDNIELNGTSDPDDEPDKPGSSGN